MKTKKYCIICGTLKISKNGTTYNPETGKLMTYLICPHAKDLDCKHNHDLKEPSFWKAHDFECKNCDYKEYPYF